MAWLDKMVSRFVGADLPRFEKGINENFQQFSEFDRGDRHILLQIVQGQQPFGKIARHLLSLSERGEVAFDFLPLARFLQNMHIACYRYWLREDDPLTWFLGRCAIAPDDFHSADLFRAISHETIAGHLTAVRDLEVRHEPVAAIKAILAHPEHIDIVKYYRTMPTRLAEADGVGEEAPAHQFNENRKLLFLFKIMDTTGLSLIHEETLREINRSLVHLIRQQSFEEIEEFLLTTFKLLKANVRKFPHTSLQCIQVLGGEVFDRGNSRMVEAFLWGVVRFGFQHAGVVGVDENWQPLANPAHLANIRVWLYLIMREPKWCSTLFSALIIHLKLSGTCNKDTDLFQRDITQLLNHPIEPIYNLSKQFAKLMPVFFNEIGSEGELRDVSTELDEIHKRQDQLIHFLRKQGHVESSNLIVDFVQAIFAFWKTGDKTLLIPYLPEEVYGQIKAEGIFIDDLRLLSARFWPGLGIHRIEDILGKDLDVIGDFLSQQTDLSGHEVRRFELLIRMYKLLYKKYNLGVQQLRGEIDKAVNRLTVGMIVCASVIGGSLVLNSSQTIMEFTIEFLGDRTISLTGLLGICNHMKRQRRLARRFRAKDFDHPAARQPTHAHCHIQRKRTSRNTGNLLMGFRITKTHNRAFAKFLTYLLKNSFDLRSAWFCLRFLLFFTLICFLSFFHD